MIRSLIFIKKCVLEILTSNWKEDKMKIISVDATPLIVPYKEPYYWAQGIMDGANVLLIEIKTDSGLIGYGECISTPSPEGVKAFIKEASRFLIGEDTHYIARLMDNVYHALFQARGTCSSPRFGAQVLAGLEMALWDIAGKEIDRPVNYFFGGAVHDEISYFGFPQGENPRQIATNARDFVELGHDVIYVKVGTGVKNDIEIIKAVRAAIGPTKRLRVDPNEHWGVFEIKQILPAVADCDIECIEQPTHCESISALKKIRNKLHIPIAADQLVFSPQDCFDVCKEDAADLIVLGLHETGGIGRFINCGRIAETARVNINIHGLYETGITTCATNQAASVLPNLDDGNQYMNHFLKWDIIKGSNLDLTNGRMKIVSGVGLGFDIDMENVARAHEIYQESVSK